MEMNTSNISNKLMNRFFRKVDDVVWDLMTGKIGVKTVDGIATLTGVGDDAQIELNMLEQFGFALPAFAQNTPTIAVNVGDLVVGNKGIQGWVIEKKEKSLVLMKPDGSRGSMTPPKVNMMGTEGGVMVLRSLNALLPGGESGLGQMQSMLLPMMMMGGEDSGMDFEKMMPMMLMSQMNMFGAAPTDPAAGAAANPMASMLPMMMMMNMMGGKSGGNGSTGGSGKGFFDKRS